MNDSPSTFNCGRCAATHPGERRVEGTRLWALPETLRACLTDQGWFVICKDDQACLARQAETRGIVDEEPRG